MMPIFASAIILALYLAATSSYFTGKQTSKVSKTNYVDRKRSPAQKNANVFSKQATNNKKPPKIFF
jgi:hypothetical protein